MNTTINTTINAIADLPTLAPRTARPVKRKTRITIYLDDEVLSQFRSLSEQSGKGYQTLINAALRSRLSSDPVLA
ncbi:MAG: BrnA antitoxin family protein [Massilia sp.]